MNIFYLSCCKLNMLKHYIEQLVAVCTMQLCFRKTDYSSSRQKVTCTSSFNWTQKCLVIFDVLSPKKHWGHCKVKICGLLPEGNTMPQTSVSEVQVLMCCIKYFSRVSLQWYKKIQTDAQRFIYIRVNVYFSLAVAMYVFGKRRKQYNACVLSNQSPLLHHFVLNPDYSNGTIPFCDQ